MKENGLAGREEKGGGRMVFCSDLDNTLIYSYKREIGPEKVCVELYEGREASFMTARSYRLLKEAAKQTLLVPVTTRTREQYERIDLGIGTPPYALVCNGGVLLKNGEEDEAWYRQSLALIERSRAELDRARLLLLQDKDRSMELRNIRELFLFTKSGDPDRTVRRLQERLDPRLVQMFQNGCKVYAVPAGLDKGTAVRRLRDLLGAEKILAAGDSAFDLPMLREADEGVAPKELLPHCPPDSRIFGLPGRAPFSDRLLEYVTDGLWSRIKELQGTVFATKKGLPFTYYIKGGELFASRRERSITRSTFEKAYEKILENPEEAWGPKKLNVYGAPYVWAILSAVMEAQEEET